jgi:hypothetical protein
MADGRWHIVGNKGGEGMSQVLAENNTALHVSGEQESAAHALERIRDALRGLRFGTVTVIVQDGFVVQVERTEKLRLVRRRE